MGDGEAVGRLGMAGCREFLGVGCMGFGRSIGVLAARTFSE